MSDSDLLPQLHLLVVDHEPDLRQLTTGLLRGLAVGSTDKAGNGADALQAMRNRRPDLVMADWQLPGMDGLALLQAMRADPALSDIPMILVMADVERSLVQQAVAAGVSDLLVKPYTLRRLEEKILRAVSRGAPVAELASPAAPPAKPLVLVVDDTPDNLRLMAGLLGEDYQVKVADNGEKALAICAGAVPPDLVLLDVMMPGMDGFEVARRLRAQPSGEMIPVVFVTALTDERSRVQGLDLGAVDFVSKPVDPEVLLPRVRNFMRYMDLHKRRQQEFDEMLAQAKRLREEVQAPIAQALTLLRAMPTDPALAPVAQLLQGALAAAGRTAG